MSTNNDEQEKMLTRVGKRNEDHQPSMGGM